jgi:hypothetical protein
MFIFDPTKRITGNFLIQCHFFFFLMFFWTAEIYYLLIIVCVLMCKFPPFTLKKLGIVKYVFSFCLYV